MSFLETVSKVRAYLEANSRVSLRGLRREFGLDEAEFTDLVMELTDVQAVAALEGEGEVLVWLGAESFPPRDGPPRPAAHQAAERRQLTVVFIDLVGSTALRRARYRKDPTLALLSREDLGRGLHLARGTREPLRGGKRVLPVDRTPAARPGIQTG